MEKVLKIVAIAIVIVVVFMVVTGNMGGARDATGNYHGVMTGGK